MTLLGHYGLSVPQLPSGSPLHTPPTPAGLLPLPFRPHAPQNVTGLGVLHHPLNFSLYPAYTFANSLCIKISSNYPTTAMLLPVGTLTNTGQR